MSIKDCKNLNSKDPRFTDVPNVEDLIEKKPVAEAVEQVPVNTVISAPKKVRDVKVCKSTRIDKSTKEKIDEIVAADKFFNPSSTLSFNEIINLALEEWASKKEHIELRKKFAEIRKSYK